MADLSQFEHVFHPDGKLLVRIDDHWFFVDRVVSSADPFAGVPVFF